MERFEYAHPTTQREAIGLLGSNWNDAAVLAGGTDLISLMKEYVVSPKRIVNIKNVEGLNGIHSNAEGVTLGSLVTMDELVENETIRAEFPALTQAAEGITSPQIRHCRRRALPAPALLVLPQRLRPAGEGRKREIACARRRESLPRHPRQ